LGAFGMRRLPERSVLEIADTNTKGGLIIAPGQKASEQLVQRNS